VQAKRRAAEEEMDRNRKAEEHKVSMHAYIFIYIYICKYIYVYIYKYIINRLFEYVHKPMDLNLRYVFFFFLGSGAEIFRRRTDKAERTYGNHEFRVSTFIYINI
jgi:hypothetical protein